MKKILKAIHGSDKTPLRIGQVEIPCYVLEDGMRVLSGRGIQKALGANPNASGTWLKKFFNESPLTPFLHPGILDILNNPIEFDRNTASGSQSKTNGYEATILIDICDSVIEASKSRAIDPNILVSAERILRSVAKVGIIALVDEATGYQYDREKDELQKILRAYISEELLPWQKTFPDRYYIEIFRLNGWDFTVESIKKRPGVVGIWTNKVIYNQLPKGVLKELKSQTPKTPSGNYKARFFQSLTQDIGNVHLQNQLNSVITLMQVADDWKDFLSKFNKLVDRRNGQLELKFNDLEYKPENDKPPEKLKGTKPPPLRSSGQGDFDDAINLGLKKGKPPDK